MNQLDKDRDAIERVGEKAIMAHFQISRQAVHYWRHKGIPLRHRKTFDMLAALAESQKGVAS